MNMASTTIDKITRGEKPESPVAKFAAFMDKLKPQMALALPKHITADRMVRLVMTTFRVPSPPVETSVLSTLGSASRQHSTLFNQNWTPLVFLVPASKGSQ
jgi:recombination protein RecT